MNENEFLEEQSGIIKNYIQEKIENRKVANSYKNSKEYINDLNDSEYFFSTSEEENQNIDLLSKEFYEKLDVEMKKIEYDLNDSEYFF